MTKVRAYAILDGGGVKGAALAGCLAAAEQLNFEFAGYGGTSAGAIVATLACAGYSTAELKTIVTEELNFRDLLDDGGKELERLKGAVREVARARASPWAFVAACRALWREWGLINRVMTDLGLYSAKRLEEFIDRKVRAKLVGLGADEALTLAAMERLTGKQLKMLASDVTTSQPVVYSAKEYPQTPVVEAVRASMCYPFVFAPVVMHRRLLADGGLSSNLPVFMFQEERRATGAQVIAFDLITKPGVKVAGGEGVAGGGRGGEGRFFEYCKGLLSTALDASERIIDSIVDGVIRVPVVIERDIHAMDFDIGREVNLELFATGENAVFRFFRRELSQWQDADGVVRQIQARFGTEDRFRTVLNAAALEMQIGFDLLEEQHRVRAHIMLPTGRGTRIVAYQVGMDDDFDNQLELPMDVGGTGEAWRKRAPVCVNGDRVKHEPESFGMTREQAKRIPEDIRFMIAVPIFTGVGDRGGRGEAAAGNEGNGDERGETREEASGDGLAGILTFDCTAELDPERDDQRMIKWARGWADVVGAMLAYR